MSKEQQLTDARHELARVIEQRDALLDVAKEIAHDSRCDLVDSDRRIRLYAAIMRTEQA